MPKNDQTEQRKQETTLNDLLYLRDIAECLQLLIAYGMISTVDGVVYPGGSHRDVLKRANNIHASLMEQI